MLMVVFGAGASHDSVPKANWSHEMAANADNHQPPVASSLFDLHRTPFLTAARRFDVAGAGGLITELQAAAQHGSESVEENLQGQALRAAGDDLTVQCQLLAVRYYLKEVVATSTSVWEELAGRAHELPGVTEQDRPTPKREQRVRAARELQLRPPA
jgi:hypothetical protein